MKSIGLAWRMVVWMLAIGWIPVIVEELLDSLFHLSQRNCCDILILIILYIYFITLPPNISCCSRRSIQSGECYCTILSKQQQPERNGTASARPRWVEF